MHPPTFLKALMKVAQRLLKRQASFVLTIGVFLFWIAIAALPLSFTANSNRQVTNSQPITSQWFPNTSTSPIGNWSARAGKSVVQSTSSFKRGDVFISLGSGKIQRRSPTGAILQTLDTGTESIIAGIAFDRNANLYAATVFDQRIVKFNNNGNLIGNFATILNSSNPESIIFDSDGNSYVGIINGDPDVRKLDKNGNQIDAYEVPTEQSGTNWIDLASDKCTLYYTSQGKRIFRYNVCTKTVLPNFVENLPGHSANGLRLLSGGGLIVADESEVLRLDAAGKIVQRYDALGEDHWLAIDLDPDGSSFWSADVNTGNVYKFDIATGNQLTKIQTGSSVFGLAIFSESWVSNGPDGGEVNLVAINSTNPSIVYAGTSNGLYKSTNAGDTWERFSNGLPQNSHIGAIGINPVNPNILYIGISSISDSGVYKSTDGGMKWERFSNGLPQNSGVITLSISSINPNIVYAGSYFDGVGVYKTTNGGMSWERFSNGLPQNSGVIGLVINPVDQSILYVGATDGVYKTTNGGMSWERFSNGLPQNASAGSIVINPVDPRILYVAAVEGVYKTTNGGMSWERFSNGLPGFNLFHITVLVIDPHNTNVLYAGSFYGNGVYKSINGGASWGEISNGLRNFIVRDLALNPVDTSVLYAATGGGVFKTFDRGAGWGQSSHGLPYAGIRALAVSPQNLNIVYVGTNSGVYKSINGGASWSSINNDLPSADINGLVVNASDPNVLYAAVQAAGVYKSTNGGMKWERFSNGLPGPFVYNLAISPTDPSILFVWAYSSGIYKSTNSGSNWHQSNTGFTTEPSFAQFTFSPAEPNVVYASVSTGSEAGIYKSTNGGDSWRKVWTFTVSSLLVSSVDTNVLYAGTSNGLYKSTNGGDTWERFSNGLLNIADWIYALVSDPVNANVFYAGGSFGVYKTTNGGASWIPFNYGISQQNLVSTLFSNRDGKVLYAGTSSGVYIYNYNETIQCTLACNARVPEAGNVNATILFRGEAFHSNCTGTSTFEWDFGDGVKSSQQNPEHAYAQAGNYTWKLTVKGPNGRTCSKTNILIVGNTLSNRWVVISPTGSGISSIDVNSTNSNVIHALAGNKIYKSANGGGSWSQINLTGVTNPITFAVDPANTNVIYVGTLPLNGVFKTTNGGGSWSQINNIAAGFRPISTVPINGLVIDRKNTSIIYASTGGAGIYKSTNNGGIWSQMNNGLPSDNSSGPPVTHSSGLFIDPSNSSNLYVLLGKRGVYKSMNGGGSWSAINTGLPIPSSSIDIRPPIRTLAVDPSNSNIIYAGTEHNQSLGGVYKSANSGGIWSQFNSALTGFYTVTALAIDSSKPNVVYAGTEANSDSIIKNIGTSADWQPFSNELPEITQIRQLEISTSGRTLYAVTDQGLFIYQSSETPCQLACSATAPPSTNVGAPTRFSATATPTGCTGTPKYEWAFGDGSGSTEQTPQHIYKAKGTYTWRVTVNMTGASLCSQSGTITVNDACSLSCNAVVPSTAKVSDQVQFSATSTLTNCTGTSSYEWDFGDGTAKSTQQNPKHAYTQAKPYTWTLIVRGPQGTICSKTGTITIGNNCTLTCNATVTDKANVGVAVEFKATATLSNCTGTPTYEWDFGDGTPKSLQQNPNHVYTMPRIYNWKLTVSIAGATACVKAGTIAIFNQSADVAIGVTASAISVVPGAEFTYEISVSNNGPDVATEVRVTDNLPAEVTYVACSAAAGGTCSGIGNQRTIIFPSLASRTLNTISITARVNKSVKSGTLINNTVSGSTAVIDPFPSNNTKAVEVLAINPLIFVPGVAASKIDIDGENLWLGGALTNHLNLTLDPSDARSRKTVIIPDVLRRDIITAFDTSSTRVDTYITLLERLSNPRIGRYYEYQVNNNPVRRTSSGCDYNGQKAKSPTLFVFAYDWRRSNEQAADQLADYIGCVRKFYGQDIKIDVIAHSMGGLVTRRYIMKYPSNHGISKLITFGSPWLGTPKAIGALKIGYFLDQTFRALLVTDSTIKQLSEFFPGVHELLPSKSYFDLGGNPYNYQGRDQDYLQFRSRFDENDFKKSQPVKSGADFHDKSQQDDWRSDTSGVLYYHLYGIRRFNKTVVRVKEQLVTRCNSSVGGFASCVSVPQVDLLFGGGDSTVSTLSLKRMGAGFDYNAPGVVQNNRLIEFAAKNDPCSEDKYDDQDNDRCKDKYVGHTELTGNLKAFCRVVSILGVPSPQACASVSTQAQTLKTLNQSQTNTPNVDAAYYLRIAGTPTITVTNSAGRRTDPLATPPDKGIPGVSSAILGEGSAVVILPADDNFDISFRSSDKPLRIELNKGTDLEPIQTVRYSDLVLPANVMALLKITPQGVEILRYDRDGNGTFETTVQPTTNLTGEAARDIEPPSLRISANVQLGIATVTITGEDKGTGVNSIHYSLDGIQFKPYTSALVVNPVRNQKVYAFADDKAANRSSLVTYKIASLATTVSAATFNGAVFASESIVAAFGIDLATTTQVSTTLPLPTSLAGSTVKVKDSVGTERLAPLFFVSPTQINYQIPPGTAVGAAFITIISANGAVAVGEAQITPVAPGLFTANSSGQGILAGVALRVPPIGAWTYEPIAQFNASINRFVPKPIDLGPLTPAPDRVFLIMFCTGIRGATDPNGDGNLRESIRVSIDGYPITLIPDFAGKQGRLVGIDQINVEIPRSLAGRGETNLTVLAGGNASNTARISIK